MTQKEIMQRQQDNEEVNSQLIVDAKSKKKTKLTIYLTEEAELAFAELFILRFRKDRKINQSAVACEAIQALYEKEKLQNK